MTAFVALSLLVATRVTQPVDSRALEMLRPHDEWGGTQAFLMPVIDALQPGRMFVLLALVGVGASLLRASWRPAAYAALVAVPAVAITVVTKFAVHRPDPHSEMSGLGGSYPSGHVLAILVCLGGCVLVVWHLPRWWHWLLVGLSGAAMAAALLFTAAHWLTDVVGGALLAVAVLALASSLPLGSTPRPCEDTRGPRNQPRRNLLQSRKNRP